MEIHAPRHPILTWREAAAHLAIVTVGILIALSFEGLLEWRHHRALVREAKANLTAEIRDNRNEITRFLGRLRGMQESFAKGIDVLNALPAEPDRADLLFRPGANNASSVMSNFDIAELRASSRTTAELTGAFSYMEYGDAQSYAAVYDRQQLFTRAQDRAIETSAAAFALGQRVNFQKASAGEVEPLKQQLRLALGSLFAMEEFARALKASYARGLGESP